ncbi:MAG: hypothetical protein HY924_11870 [Elusimicrobia bacterium]|nr:hypothetical protein [Elusimicrobiota bacterium]
MVRTLAAALSLILTLEPALWAAQGAPSASAPAAETAAERQERLTKLVELLKSLTDEEYEAALKDQPAGSSAPQFASRTEALGSAYKTLAGLEYQQASQTSPEAASSRYSEAYTRVSAKPDGLQETGAEIEVLKWVANAVLNYWVSGGKTYVGRSIGTANDDETLAGLDTQLASAELDPSKKAELHYQRGALFERLSQAPAGSDAEAERLALKQDRLQKLADLLNSVTDEEYTQALASAPKASGSSMLASRNKALNSAYTTLAALEYRQAVKTAPEGASKDYAAAYERVSRSGAKSLVVDPETLQDTGLAADVFKFLGNAVLNYWLNGGENYMARGWKGKGSTDGPEASQEEASASISPAKSAEQHFQQGSAYEDLAAEALKADEAGNRAAVRGQRLKVLAGLLESVTDEEYGQVVGALPAGSPAASLPASRDAVLKGTYATLAALEYRSAGDAAKTDLERVSRGSSADLGVDPGSLQETGWGTKLLGLLALGGLGYGIYELQRGRGRPGKAMAKGQVKADDQGKDKAHGQDEDKDKGKPEKVKLRKDADGLELKLASASAGPEQASLHRQLGQAYEKLAASVVVEAPAAAAKAPAPAKAPAGPAASDMLFLWDGSRLDGTITAATPAKIVLKSDQGVTGVRQDRIRAVILAGSEVDADAEDLRTAASQGKLPLIVKADGTMARGRLASAAGKKLHFKLSSGVLSLSRDEVRAVVFPK